ncbi:MAG: hypothetical protein J5J00_06530 [Deltaproteobacteria bacterium]|nr:hypothetical protein [Deltaproteobacteria bacterium]
MHDFEYRNLDAISRRPDGPSILVWRGLSTSLDVLPRIGLSWSALEDIVKQSGKPALDLGADFSTLSAEGFVRGIEIVPLDIMLHANREIYVEQTRRAGEMFSLERYYAGSVPFPRGMDADGFTMNEADWNTAFHLGAREALKKGICCDAARIPRADRSFSCVIANDSIPKHSPTADEFVLRQLPEVLRVTDHSAYFLPFSRYVTAWEESTPVMFKEESFAASAILMQRIEETAWRYGFSFTLVDAAPLYRPLMPGEYTEENTQVGVFRRLPEAAIGDATFGPGLTEFKD